MPLSMLVARRTSAIVVVASGVLVAALAAAAPAGSATRPGPATLVPVAQDVRASALPGATVFGNTPPGTPETVSFVLRARNLGQLEQSVQSGMPGGYLSVSQFASSFGQPTQNITALTSYLAQYGISASAYPDGLDVTANGTAGEFDQALSIQQKQYSVPAVRGAAGQPGTPAKVVHGSADAPLLPDQIAQYVLSVLGITNYPSFATSAVHTPQAEPGAKVDSTAGDAQTPADFARSYNLDPLYAKGYTGAGQTIGIVTLASVDPTVPNYFWKNILHLNVPANRIKLVNVDGGAGPVSVASGSDETTLDVEQSGALAPDANIVVYQAPNTDPGFADAFFDAASQNAAGSVSVSWASSETALAAAVAAQQESPTYVQAFDEAFLELAAQGQSMFASSGDAGAYDAIRDLGTTNLTVNYPGGSAFVTSAGGTTLPGSISLTQSNGQTASANIPAERAWGWDWLWPLWQGFGAASEATFAEAEHVGGGGGYSIDEGTPRYQQSVSGTRQFSAVQYLTPTSYQNVDGLTLPTAWNFNPAPAVTRGTGNGRATPDVSADADPFTGYEIYDPQFTGAALEGGWGGTSFVAPQLNGAAAVIDQYVGHRLGFWNPSIYRFASQPGSPFTPLDASGTSNDNLYYTGTHGQIYNAGSGLGTPDLSQLAADFARQTDRAGLRQ